jgi:hypothetical protein
MWRLSVGPPEAHFKQCQRTNDTTGFKNVQKIFKLMWTGDAEFR